MADFIAEGFDNVSGQKKQLDVGDQLVDLDGNPLNASSSSTLLATATGIDFTTSGGNNLYTVPTGSTCIITDCILLITSVSGYTSAGSCVIEKSDLTKTYLQQQSPPTNWQNADQIWSFTRTISVAYADAATAGDIVRIRRAVSWTSTTMDVNVYLFGILV